MSNSCRLVILATACVLLRVRGSAQEQAPDAVVARAAEAFGMVGDPPQGHPESTQMLSVSRDGKEQVWLVSYGEQIATIGSPIGRVLSLVNGSVEQAVRDTPAGAAARFYSTPSQREAKAWAIARDLGAVLTGWVFVDDVGRKPAQGRLHIRCALRPPNHGHDDPGGPSYEILLDQYSGNVLKLVNFSGVSAAGAIGSDRIGLSAVLDIARAAVLSKRTAVRSRLGRDPYWDWPGDGVARRDARLMVFRPTGDGEWTSRFAAEMAQDRRARLAWYISGGSIGIYVDAETGNLLGGGVRVSYPVGVEKADPEMPPNRRGSDIARPWLASMVSAGIAAGVAWLLVAKRRKP